MNPIILTFLALSLFSQKDEKEKKQLHNNAETAFSQADYSTAKKAYSELFKKMEKPNDDWQNYVDIIVRYAETNLLLKEYSEGTELLLNLLKRNPPAEFHSRITVLLARLYSFQEQAGKGYVLMHQACQKIPLEKWRPEERSFFHAVEYSLNSYFENLMQKAKHFTAASAYKEALNAYEEIANGIKLGYFPSAVTNPILEKKVLFRLAECHYLSANFEKTLLLADSIEPPKDELDAEMLFLAALCYKEKREFEKALLCFQNYLVISDVSVLFHYESALFEIGQFYFRNGNIEKAKEYFEKLVEKRENPSRPILIGALCLGKIYLQEKKQRDAEALFLFVQDCLKTDDPLHFEATFLLGEVFFQQKHYQKAACFFEKALIPSGSKGDWTKSALYKLALSYTRQKNKDVMKKGEEILEKLLQHEFDEEIALALADYYVSQNNAFKFNELLLKVENTLTEATKREFRLLQCSLKSSYEEKEAILQIVTNLEDTANENVPHEILAKGLYYQALNDLEQGLATDDNRDFYFRKAIDALKTAFNLVEKNNEKTASQLLHLEIKAHSLLKDPMLAFSLFQRLNADPDTHEKLYLKALLLSQMESSDHKALAIKKFEESIAIQPLGEYADDALFALGTLYYKQNDFAKSEECFIRLIETYPSSEFANVAYFWSAEAAEKGGGSSEKCFMLRTCQYEKYPLSPKAADAYFKCFNMEQYLQGHEKALVHIRCFPTLFPHSDLLALSYFLIGYNETSYPIARATLEKALELFDKIKHKDVSFGLFRYRTMLELALLEVHYAQDMTFALKMLLTLVSELQDMPACFKETTPYPSIYEESEFALFQIYNNLKKETLAYEVLLSMLKHYSEAGITEGFYLSEVWKHQGLLAFEAKDYVTAITCYGVALECGEKYLNAEQRFSLQLHQSDCYRAKGEYDNAMRALSQIINEECDSHLRLKAMFLRAEIYELQGREELGYRQLLALSKKEGKWALEAKERLRKVYGIFE